MPVKQGSTRMKELAASERDAKRPADFRDRQLADFSAMTSGLRGLSLALAVAEHAAKWTGLDPGIPPEFARDQATRTAAALAKVADPLRKIADLEADLRAAHEEIAGLKERIRARSTEPTRNQGIAAAGAIQ